jgi:hypothetical protein
MFLMSKQAWVIAIVYALCILIGLIGSIVSKKFTLGAAFGTLFSILFVALITYDTACLTNGFCGAWSWIRTLLYVFFPVVGLVVFFIALVAGKKSTAPSMPPMPMSMPQPGKMLVTKSEEEEF